jgi:hypothetical protein
VCIIYVIYIDFENVEEIIMSIWVNVVGMVGKIFEPALKALDELITSEEEVMIQKNKLAQIKVDMQKIQNSLIEKFLELESKVIEAQQAIIVAEAQGDSWMQRNWRPMLMIMFALIIVTTWLGLSSDKVNTEMQLRLIDMVQGGLYGYIGLRSVEKIGTTIRKKISKRRMDKLNKVERLEAKFD